jgi:protein TonB
MSDVEPMVDPLPVLAKPMDAGVSALVGEITSERPGESLGRNTGPGGDGDGSPMGAGHGPGGIGDGVRAGGPGVTTPVVITQVKPQYTADAMRAKVQGLVMVECVVLPDGTVDGARIVRSLDPRFGLDQEAIAAARKWRFRPGLLNGKPVPVIVTIELSFTLR